MPEHPLGVVVAPPLAPVIAELDLPQGNLRVIDAEHRAVEVETGEEPALGLVVVPQHVQHLSRLEARRSEQQRVPSFGFGERRQSIADQRLGLGDPAAVDRETGKSEPPVSDVERIHLRGRERLGQSPPAQALGLREIDLLPEDRGPYFEPPPAERRRQRVEPGREVQRLVEEAQRRFELT